MSRDHLVYRALDEFGLLLYVGVTTRPQGRWNQHQAHSSWAQYARSFRVTGPLPRDRAFALEQDEIRRLAPYFNVAHRATDHSSWDYALPRIRQITAPSGSAEWHAAMDQLITEVDHIFSPEALYLDERRQHAVRSA